MKIFIGLVIALLSTQSVYSTESQFETIQSVEMFEVLENEDGTVQTIALPNGGTSNVYLALAKGQGVTMIMDGTALMMTKKLIALGKEVYDVVKKGKPVVNVTEAKPIEVLPINEKGEAIGAYNLAGWKAPMAKKYKIVAKNYLGLTPVEFEFMVIFNYGGSLDGRGRYITGAQIKPTSVNVKWGYEFNASFKVQTIVNEGSHEAPVAGAVLVMDSKIETVMQEQMLSKTFYINGVGNINSY